MSCQYFRENHTACTACGRDRTFSEKENKSKYTLKNPHQREVCSIIIDGCVSSGNDEYKCDYLFLSCETSVAYFVELKGKALLHAIEQLDRSVDAHKANLNNHIIHARAVLTKTQTPDLRTTKYKKFVKKMKRLGGSFVHRNKLLEESLD